MRIGIGYDIHRLVKGRKLVLGGVEIPFTKGLDGHSDADVALHALSDAMLGALSLGDIGQHFPDDDPKYKGAHSGALLLKVNNLIESKGFSVNNADIVIVIEKPRIAPFVAGMKKKISGILGVEEGRVGVAATTHEALGPIGKGKAVASYAVVTLTEGNKR
ncbi:MAG: 2-C-methyl-D-erythritol 2,4-cyclodiphosphate synthase [Omnitrophica bacterium]|nr:2-C-methyl-D-erythritol 2,4-cyclodiphosphate synthase [Candidatus Omnitrophota bacterium]